IALLQIARADEARHAEAPAIGLEVPRPELGFGGGAGGFAVVGIVQRRAQRPVREAAQRVRGGIARTQGALRPHVTRQHAPIVPCPGLIGATHAHIPSWSKASDSLKARPMKTRTETDTFGPIEVESDKYWGAQAQRSLQNFKIGEEKMPAPIVRALGIVKRAAAEANMALGVLKPEIGEVIVRAAQEVIDGKRSEERRVGKERRARGTPEHNMNKQRG